MSGDIHQTVGTRGYFDSEMFPNVKKFAGLTKVNQQEVIDENRRTGDLEKATTALNAIYGGHGRGR